MPSVSSLLDLKKLSVDQIKELFFFAENLQKNQPKILSSAAGKTLALLFFEPSTRTRLSFETAAHRIGLGPLRMDDRASTSLEKGESIEDSIYNVAAMGPELIVVRCGDEVELDKVAAQISMPVINAGWGKRGHPTQALLDLYTMLQVSPQIEGKKIVFVGDISHSRVAASHFELLQSFGADVQMCGPKDWLPSMSNQAFHHIDQVVENADFVVMLRVQLERHGSGTQFSASDYRQSFGLTTERLARLKKSARVLHPGPINHGVELDSLVLQDPRCLVLKQVANGVSVREAILRKMLTGELL